MNKWLFDHSSEVPTNEKLITEFRQQLKKDIVDILETIASSDGRRLRARCLPFGLDYLLTHLCPVPFSAPGTVALPVDYQEHLHYARCLIGAFTDREATLILRKLTDSRDESTLNAMIHVRRTCLESLDKFYSTLKS